MTEKINKILKEVLNKCKFSRFPPKPNMERVSKPKVKLVIKLTAKNIFEDILEMGNTGYDDICIVREEFSKLKKKYGVGK